MACRFNYIQKQNISESEKNRLSEIHINVFTEALKSKAFRKFNNKLYPLRFNKQAAYAFVAEINSKYNANIASMEMEAIGKRKLTVNTLPLSNEIQIKLPDNINQNQLSLFGLNLNNDIELEFHVNTLNVINQFLEKAGIEQRLVPQFLSQDGSIVEGAIAAANFIEGTVDIIEDIEKRPFAWNKLPEEAAHFWYRLLNENSELKKELWNSHLTALKNDELYKGQYGKLVKSPSDLTEESIGQLIAEAIKRIETKNANASDYSFFKKFLEWINSIIDIFKTTTQDPFEVAAMKILSSDMSDLMTWEEYRKLNNIVNFADVLTEQSVAPIDYTLIEDLGKVEKINEVVGFTNDGKRINQEKFLWVGKDQQVNGGLQFGKTSPSFLTMEELARWVSANIKQYDTRQKQRIQEVRDNQQFFDRLLNKTFRKRSKFLPKTLKKYYVIVHANNLNQLQEWNINQELQKITKKLSEQEKKTIIETNGYTNITPTLRVLPILLDKYKKNPIVLSQDVKIDGAKKQELNILNNIREMIRLENPDKKSITAEEFVNEVHNWLETNYLLGFASETQHDLYNVNNTFIINNSDGLTNPNINANELTEEEIRNMPYHQRQQIANWIGLTENGNRNVYHNKVSIHFNDTTHEYYGQENRHFVRNGRNPSAFGSLTYFYTGKNKWKDAVLLHEIQNDNIEALRELKLDKVNLEESIGRYLQQLNSQLLDNIQKIESGGKKIVRDNIRQVNHFEKEMQSGLKSLIMQVQALPFEQGLNQLKSRVNELIELYKGEQRNNPEIQQEKVEKAYSELRKWSNFTKIHGGIKGILSKEDLGEIEDILIQLNNSQDNYGNTRNLKQKKQSFQQKTLKFYDKINNKLEEMYGKDAPDVSLSAPVKPRTVSEKRQGLPKKEELNDNINWLIAYNEQQVAKNLYKNIEQAKKDWVYARNQTVSYNFNQKLSKITLEQYTTLIENYKYNQDLLNRLVDEAAKKDLVKADKQKFNFSTTEVKNSIQPISNGYEQTYYSEILGFPVYGEDESSTINKVFETINEINDKEGQREKQNRTFDYLKKKALDKKAELEKNYGKLEEEARQTLEIEMNYFTPLVHHLIQKHINQYGKDFPMYFAGYNITKLTQGNDRTALIYAGKDEVNTINRNKFSINGKEYHIENAFLKDMFSIKDEKTGERRQYLIIKDPANNSKSFIIKTFNNEGSSSFKEGNITEQEYNKAKEEYEKAYQQATEQKAKEIKKQAAIQIGLATKEDSVEEAIKKLNRYKQDGNSDGLNAKKRLDRVIYAIMNISNNKPIETGALYNAMSQVSGVKLIWQDKIEGLQNNAGGYLVDLSGYNYNVPVLYALKENIQDFNKNIASDNNLLNNTDESNELFCLL